VTEFVQERLDAVRARIRRAAEAAGRDPGQVRLLAVSKTKGPELIREAYAAGQRDFGENYVQELIAKADVLSDLTDLRFHLIGHLQRNKVRHVVGIASAVHTVDSLRLAEELGKRALAVGNERRIPGADDERLPVFVEVNVGGEANKSGCTEACLGAVLDAVDGHEALHLVGLMTVPPHTDDPEGAYPYFDALVRLRGAHGGAERMPELSMGMSHDLEQAVRAGATWVRIGTAIFGARSG
jgi:PLP dependent protein